MRKHQLRGIFASKNARPIPGGVWLARLYTKKVDRDIDFKWLYIFYCPIIIIFYD